MKSRTTDTSPPRPASGSKALSGPFGEKGRYQIIKQIGTGGMGAVYLATDTRMERSVALKVTHFSANDEEMRDRFIREARLLAKISHPNLGVVYDVDEFDGTHFQTMEYIEGKSLASYIKSRRMTPKQAVTLVRKSALALAEAHSKGVVHRDLKPQNIMLRLPGGEPKVIDFGLAVNVSGNTSRLTKSGTQMGTLPYMPIEQINGEITKIGPRSDVNSLGVVLYELLTGTLPFPGEFLTEVLAKMIAGAVPVTQHQTDLDPRLDVIVMKAIAKEPADRYDSMIDFAAALQAFLKSEQSGTPQTSVAGEIASADTARSTDNPVRVSGATDISPATSDPLTTDDDESLALSFFDQLRSENENPPTFVSGVKRPASPSTSGRRAAGSSNANSSSLTSIVKSLPGPIRSLIAPSPDQRTPQRRVTLIALATLLVALLYGVTLWFRSGDALVKVELLTDDIEVTFNNETIKLADGVHEYKVKPGEHTLLIKSGNVEFNTDKFTLKKGDNPAVTVELVKDELVAKFGEAKIGAAVVEPPDLKRLSGQELLTNGGCEQPLNGGQIPGWEATRGDRWTVETREALLFEGKACFRPGRALSSELFQDVSLEPFADSVQNGKLEISFQEHVLSTSATDKARAIVEFRDKTNTAVVDSYDTGFMSLNREWQQIAHARIVPRNTGWVRVRLITSMQDLDDRNVFFDSISLKASTVGSKPLVRIPADAKSFETHFYKYFNEKLPWKAAKAKCESLGGNLVVIDSADENKFVADIIAAATEDESWIGITDEAQEGTWLTVTGQPLAFTNWLQGQPDNKQSREHFALMTNREYLGQRPGWKWCDRNNQDLSLHEPGFVCEWITPSSIAKSLFNGRNLDGWEVGTGAASAWKVSQGELVALGPSDAARGWLVTTKEYRDYRLRFDVKHTSASNSGVGLRAMPGETQNVEVQLHDELKPGTDTSEIQKFGSLYTIASRNRVPKLKPLGEWNQVEIEVRGDDVTVTVNGQQVLNRNLATLATQFPSRTDLTRRSGRIGLQSLIHEVHFRNIEIFELSMPGKERDPIPSESVTKVAVAPQVAKAPFATDKAKLHQKAWADYLGVPVAFENSIGMKFSLIPPGEFSIGGGAESEVEVPDNANLRHRVTLTQPYYLGSYEARQRDYQTVKGNNPSKFSPTNGGSLDHPVETVYYEDIEDFCRKLSAIAGEKNSGRIYRLPTEAEWEHACRAGTITRYSCGETINRTQANFTGPGKEAPAPIGKTTKVSEYAANAWGLFDVHGNVCEWTTDSNVHFTGAAVSDPRVNSNSGMRVFKGGDFGTPELVFLSSGMRYYGGLAATAAHMGFRVLLEVPADAASRQSQFGALKASVKSPGG